MQALLDELPAVETRADIDVPRPIFFMHIAKTAGSYLNSRFAAALGSERVVTHIENSIGNTADLQKHLQDGVRFFSGHVMLPLWREIAGADADTFINVCILRDPIEHLASHIQWLDHYNLPGYANEYNRLDELHRRLVDQIGAIDITDIGELDAFLVGLSGVGVRLLDNCQSRYFISHGRRVVDAITPLSLADRSKIARAAEGFDTIVFQDRLESGLAALGEATGVPLESVAKRVNPAVSARKIDTTSPLIRQVLSRRTLVDQWLVQHLRGRQKGDL